MIGTVARLGLAAVFLISGVLKAVDPDTTYVAVRAYDVLPKSGVAVVATAPAKETAAMAVVRILRIGTSNRLFHPEN